MEMLRIPTKYFKFFLRNLDERYVVLQGGRRSGKTYSTLLFLQTLASGCKRVKILVACASNSQLQATIEDFQDCLGLPVEGSQLYGYNCRLPNGSMFQFKSFDEYTKAVGQKADYMFVNEAINVDEKVFNTLVQGIRKQIFLNFNPTSIKFIEKYLNKDKSNLLITTWKDNEYLTDEQRAEFEAIKTRAQAPNATLYDKYAYQVFYLGNYSTMVGRCFEKLEYCTYNEWQDIPAQEVIVMDLAFGGSDKTAVCGFKKYGNKLFVHTYMYKQGTIAAKELAIDLLNCGFNAYTPIQCDYGGIGRTIMDKVITADNGTWEEEGLRGGFQLYNVVKGDVFQSIMALMSLDAIVIDNSNDDTRIEFEGAMLDENRKLKGDKDHTIACARYAINYFHKCGI